MSSSYYLICLLEKQHTLQDATRKALQVSPRTINNYRRREELKLFHVIPKPLKSKTHVSDRLWLWDWLKDWAEKDFLHLTLSDEFYVWVIHRTNYQKDRIWVKSIEDIEKGEKYRKMVQNQASIGIFVMFQM